MQISVDGNQIVRRIGPTLALLKPDLSIIHEHDFHSSIRDVAISRGQYYVLLENRRLLAVSKNLQTSTLLTSDFCYTVASQDVADTDFSALTGGSLGGGCLGLIRTTADQLFAAEDIPMDGLIPRRIVAAGYGFWVVTNDGTVWHLKISHELRSNPPKVNWSCLPINQLSQKTLDCDAAVYTFSSNEILVVTTDLSDHQGWETALIRLLRHDGTLVKQWQCATTAVHAVFPSNDRILAQTPDGLVELISGQRIKATTGYPMVAGIATSPPLPEAILGLDSAGVLRYF